MRGMKFEVQLLQLAVCKSVCSHVSYFMKNLLFLFCVVFFFQAEDGIRDTSVTGVQTCALPIYCDSGFRRRAGAIRFG